MSASDTATAVVAMMVIAVAMSGPVLLTCAHQAFLSRANDRPSIFQLKYIFVYLRSLLRDKLILVEKEDESTGIAAY